MTDPHRKLSEESSILNQQISYYGARAAEYDQWWLRQGRYDRGEELNARWFADCARVREALREFGPRGDTLEIACGTGIWTRELAQWRASITAVDGAAEMLSIAASKVPSSRVRYVQADIFSGWRPDGKFDTVFFGFWLSHVPPDKFDSFWEFIESVLVPQGRVFFVDSRHDPTSTASDHQLPSPESTTLTRKLNDGREFTIYKVFYEKESLRQRLEALGWEFEISHTPHYFLHGQGHRRSGELRAS